MKKFFYLILLLCSLTLSSAKGMEDSPVSELDLTPAELSYLSLVSENNIDQSFLEKLENDKALWESIAHNSRLITLMNQKNSVAQLIICNMHKKEEIFESQTPSNATLPEVAPDSNNENLQNNATVTNGSQYNYPPSSPRPMSSGGSPLPVSEGCLKTAASCCACCSVWACLVCCASNSQ